MTKTLQIGITGGIGSGKSLVCRIFAVLGISVYDADHRAKSLMTTDGILISQIRKEFGDLSYDEKGELNRTYLGEKVFSDEKQLGKLNSLVHPRVAVDYQNWLTEHNEACYVVKEAALLFEAGSNKMLDKVIVVTAPDDLRIRRVLARDSHRSRQQVQDIIKRQWSEEEKVKRADFVLVNDEKQMLLPEVLRLHRLFLNLCS